jgi:hypothetical protein
MRKGLSQEKEKVQEENIMLSNDAVSCCGGIASVIDKQLSVEY